MTSTRPIPLMRRRVGAPEGAGEEAVLITHSILGAVAGHHPRWRSARYATWIVQITCMRHTITATDRPTMPMITVLHRLRSTRAQATPATGSSTADTR